MKRKNSIENRNAMLKINNIIGLFRLFRVELPFAAGSCVVLGEILASGKIPSIPILLLGFFSIFFLSATALILNDYFDYEIDKINSPERPLPSGMVTKRDVLWLSSVVAILGFLLSFMISTVALLVAIIVWIIGFLYNWRFKRFGLIGNIMVCFSVGMTFIFGGIAAGNVFDKVVWWFAIIAMLFDLGEEIAADAMDYKGDREAGSRSIAIVWGQQKALRLSAGIFFLVICISIIPLLFHWLSWLYLLPIAIMDEAILFSTLHLINPHTVHYRKYIRLMYMSGLVATLMIIVFRIVER
jgi:geranylgeranylglycerol-phosphate geranylgeranyltransferase